MKLRKLFKLIAQYIKIICIIEFPLWIILSLKSIYLGVFVQIEIISFILTQVSIGIIRFFAL